jgi:tetratricopeptide (TPR) repeat protein
LRIYPAFRSGKPAKNSTVIVGRDALIQELIEAVSSPTVSTVLVEGEAGIGKTTLLRSIAAALEPDVAISWGSCAPDGTAAPFWPWRSVLTTDTPAMPADATLGAARHEYLTELRDALVAGATSAPALHVIEDLQWADVASVLLLSQLASTPSRLTILASVRTGELLSPPLAGALAEVKRFASIYAIPALGDDELRTLFRIASVEPSEEALTAVKRRTGGNPLFVTELLRTVPAGGDATTRARALTEALPSRVTDLVSSRVARLPEAVADAITAAATVGAEGTIATLAGALAMPEDAVLDLLDQAQATHLIDLRGSHWHFAHDLVREAIYASAPASTRAAAHARVLQALANDPLTPAPVLAHHALAGQPVVDPDRAVALAAAAAERALAQHAYEEAVGWFARALADAPSGTTLHWRATLLTAMGEASRQAGDLATARRAFLDAGAITEDPALLARAALGFADPGADLGIAYRSSDTAAAELLERALAAQPDADHPDRVSLKARLAAELYFSDAHSRSRALITEAIAEATRLQDPRALIAACAVEHDAFLVGQVPLDRQLGASRQLEEWARASGSAASHLTAHRARVFDLLAAGDLAGVDEQVVAFRRIADPLRVPGYDWWPQLWSAMRALLEGRHDEAEARALSAYATGEAPFATNAFMNLSFQLFFLRREQGRFAELEQATRDFAAANGDIPALRVALVFLIAEVGRLDEAARLLAAFDEAALDRLADRNWPASWFQLARVAFLVGDAEVSRRLLERVPTEICVTVSLATVCLGAADLATAWLAQTVGDPAQARRCYESAIAINGRIGAQSWLAQATRDLAGLSGDASPPQSEFVDHGGIWKLTFRGRTVQVADSRGMRDIAFLLRRPGTAVAVLELAGAAPSSLSRGDEIFDERARREIRAQLRALDDEEADAESAGDGERAALARAKREELAEAVARDFGLGGTSRRAGDAVERVRKTVSTRIRRTIATIGRAHPELGRHLERSIDTGTWCAYRPAEPVDWTL